MSFGESADGDEILGTTTVSDRWRISLIEDVCEEFTDEGIEIAEGDRLVYKRRDGEIVIEPA